MDFLPIFINVKDRYCLVVGGGEVAARKAAMLMRAGARVLVVSPELGAELSEQKKQGAITHLAETFRANHLDDVVVGLCERL